MAEEDTGYTRGERAAGIFGALLFLGLLVIAVDLATGGRIFKRAGCGCQEAATDDSGT